MLQKTVETVFDPAKDAINQEQHGYSLVDAALFEFDMAFEVEDTRRDYGETRMVAIGPLDGRIVILVYVQIDDAAIRAISLRRANKRERKIYYGVYDE